MTPTASESWKRMVLRSLPAPAWLDGDGPDRDVVVSSRFRAARNLSGFRFPHHCTDDELRSALAVLLEAFEGQRLEVVRRLTDAEREFLIGCRLISVEWPVGRSGRALMLDRQRAISLLLNEEDHLRLQVLTPGWSVEEARAMGESALSRSKVTWAETPEWGFLTASPFNAGSATRMSALFHLIALAHTKRIGEVLEALAHTGLVARGLFGESSRAVGAFFQVSATDGQVPLFRGACEYLIREERAARDTIPDSALAEIGRGVAEFAVTSRELGLADAFRILAFYRWGAARGLVGYPPSVREVDHLVSTLEVRANQDPERAGLDRAVTLRSQLEGLL